MGEHDPQAHFARGFGSIHTRTKSGEGFIGENYYADCENLGPVDKLGSQISFDLIQSSFYGGYRGSFADGRYGVGVL